LVGERLLLRGRTSSSALLCMAGGGGGQDRRWDAEDDDDDGRRESFDESVYGQAKGESETPCAVVVTTILQDEDLSMFLMEGKGKS
jgi:hypothetical protein